MPSIVSFPGFVLNVAQNQVSILAIEVSGIDITSYTLNYVGVAWGSFSTQQPFYFITLDEPSGHYALFAAAYGTMTSSAKHAPGLIGPIGDDPDFSISVTSYDSTSLTAIPVTIAVYDALEPAPSPEA